MHQLKFDTWFKKLLIFLPLILLLAMCVGCDPKKEVAEAPVVKPEVALPDPLRYAVVISSPHLQIMASEQCPVKVRARFPGPDGELPVADAMAACSLKLEQCTPVSTDFPIVTDEHGQRVKSTIRFIIAVDGKPGTHDPVCEEETLLTDANNADNQPAE